MAGVTVEVLHACITNARDFAPEKVRRASDYHDEFMAEWFEEVLEPGLELPFGFPWKIRPAETTVWTGIEKSGKSTMLSFILMALMAQGERALIGSFEVRPRKTLKKFSRQALGRLVYNHKTVAQFSTDQARAEYEAKARQDAEATLDWLDHGIWIYDHVGIASWREVLEDMRWARRRFGITQFVLDNFMRLGIVKDDYAQQADAMACICGFAQDTDTHVHVVVHQNKSEGHKGDRGKRSVAGAFEIIANAHNIVEVTRDEVKGKKMSELFQKLENQQIEQEEFAKEKTRLDTMPDGCFILHAQRDGELQNGSKYLWFLWESQQYSDRPPTDSRHRPWQFVETAAEIAARVRANELPTNEEIIEL
jgi:twinkle protein